MSSEVFDNVGRPSSSIGRLIGKSIVLASIVSPLIVGLFWLIGLTVQTTPSNKGYKIAFVMADARTADTIITFLGEYDVTGIEYFPGCGALHASPGYLSKSLYLIEAPLIVDMGTQCALRLVNSGVPVSRICMVGHHNNTVWSAHFEGTGITCFHDLLDRPSDLLAKVQGIIQ